MVKFYAERRRYGRGRAFHLGRVGYVISCGLVAIAVVLEVKFMLCELEYVLRVLFGPGFVYSTLR